MKASKTQLRWGGGFAWRQVCSPRHWSFVIETKKRAQREKMEDP